MDDHLTTPQELELIALKQEMESINAYMEKFNKEQQMYKPKPMNDAQLDKFLADLEPEFDSLAVKAQAEYDRLYKVPVKRLWLLEGIVGATLLLGSLFSLVWILYGIYTKVHGGIR